MPVAVANCGGVRAIEVTDFSATDSQKVSKDTRAEILNTILANPPPSTKRHLEIGTVFQKTDFRAGLLSSVLEEPISKSERSSYGNFVADCDLNPTIFSNLATISPFEEKLKSSSLLLAAQISRSIIPKITFTTKIPSSQNLPSGLSY